MVVEIQAIDGGYRKAFKIDFGIEVITHTQILDHVFGIGWDIFPILDRRYTQASQSGSKRDRHKQLIKPSQAKLVQIRCKHFKMQCRISAKS
jgi:hypothetical protein